MHHDSSMPSPDRKSQDAMIRNGSGGAGSCGSKIPDDPFAFLHL